jgi:hypothetical protein
MLAGLLLGHRADKFGSFEWKAVGWIYALGAAVKRLPPAREQIPSISYVERTIGGSYGVKHVAGSIPAE